MKTATPPSAVPVWRVVVIEDSQEDRDEIRRLLLRGSDRQYRCAEAETGAAGLRAVFDASDGPPDCVVLDYALPDMDALEVLAGMAGADGLTVCPVVVLTGSVGSRRGPVVLRAGAQDFIGKSWMTAESLTRAVENATERWAMTREIQARRTALQLSEAQLQLAVEVAGLGVNRIDYRTHTVVLDSVAAALFGLEGGLPLPRSAVHATFHPDDKAEIVRLMNQSLDPNGDGTFSMEHRVIRRDGSTRWLYVKKQVAFGEVGGTRRPVTGVLAAVDITDRKVADEQLRASEEFNRSLMCGTADCVKVLDTDGRLLHMNVPGLCTLEIDDFGPLCGQPWTTLWPAHMHSEIQRAITSASTGITHVFQAFRPTAKGRPRWWDVAVSAVRNPVNGQVVRLLVVSRDITNRKQAEATLVARERELRTLADNTPDILTRFDRDLRHVFVNAAIERATGRPVADILGKTNRDLEMPADLCDQWDAAVRNVFDAGHNKSLDFTYDTPAGPRLFTARLVPEFDADGRVEFVLGVTTDVTERKHLEEALHDAARRKDEFLATLAHELRNPLAPIRNGLQVMRMSPAGSPAVVKAREMMERQLGHMVRLVDDLMDVSRINSGKVELKREKLQIRALLDHAIEVSRPLVEAGGHTLTVKVSDEPVWVDGDLTRLAQVVSNLLNNAAKYTPNGGHIALSAGVEGDEVVIDVTDTGTGISPDMLPKVFDLFSQVDRTLDRAQGGLGIGLSLVNKLLEMHGGTVTAQSPGLGLGSTFTVRLPLAATDERHEPAAASANGTPAPRLPGRSALVVDDNVDGAESLAIMLALFGHASRVAHDGPAGLSAAREFQPEVVFLDIGLPGMSGYEVAERIRADATLPGAILVAMTGWGSEQDKQKSRAAGFDFHLTKPIEVQAAQEILAGFSRIPAG